MRGVFDKKLLLAALVGLTAVAAYFNGIDGDFVFDDIPLINTDKFYSDDNVSIFDCWARSYWPKGMDIGQYRPLTICSFLLNARLTGLNPHWFRLANLLLHIAVSISLLKLASRLNLNDSTAVLASMLFAAHPFHSEAVIPATGRAELLCAIFVILGFLAYSHAFTPATIRESEKDIPLMDKIKSAVMKSLPPLFLLLACWSKENGVVLLPLCLLYDICFKTRSASLNEKKHPLSNASHPGGESTAIKQANIAASTKKKHHHFLQLLKKHAGFAAALAILAASRLAATGSVIPRLTGRDIFIDNPVCNAPSAIRVMTALHVQGLAILKFLWPATLSHDYSFAQITPVSSMLDPLAILAVCSLLILPILILLFTPPRARPTVFFLWGAYIVSILPAGNFIVSTGTIFGERLTYLPSVWLCLATTATLVSTLSGIERKISSKRIFLPETVIGLAILAALYRTAVRTNDWKNMRTLAVSAVSTAPRSVKTWNNLAVELARRGDFEEAVAACDRALAIKPDFQSPMVNKIYYLIALKRYDEAKRLLTRVLAKDSNDYELYNKLAGILAREGKLDEAIESLRKSLAINPRQKPINDTLRRMMRERRRSGNTNARGGAAETNPQSSK